MNDISVIIPAISSETKEHIEFTINNILENAFNRDRVTVYLVADGWETKISDYDLQYPERVKTVNYKDHVGQRVIENEVTETFVTTEFIYRLDAHCSMSLHWDKLLIDHFNKLENEKVVIGCAIRGIHPITKVPNNRYYNHVFIFPNGDNKWWPKKVMQSNCELTMMNKGSGWFCTRKFFLDHLKRDEKLCKWGGLGLEMALKTYKSGGLLYTVQDVCFGHIFHTRKVSTGRGYSAVDLNNVQKKLAKQDFETLCYIVKLLGIGLVWDQLPKGYESKPDYYVNRRYHARRSDLGV